MAKARYTMFKVVGNDGFVWGWCWTLNDAEALAKEHSAKVVRERY